MGNGEWGMGNGEWGIGYWLLVIGYWLFTTNWQLAITVLDASTLSVGCAMHTLPLPIANNK